VDANVSREIEEAVQRALAAAGVSGQVTLTGRTMALRSGAAPVEIDVQFLIEQWPLLPDDLRSRKAADVAARLAGANDAAASGRPAPSAAPPAGPLRYAPPARPTGAPAKGPKKPITVPLGVLALLALTAATLWLWFRSGSPRPSPSGASSASSARAESDDERRARTCEDARAGMLKNGKLPTVDMQVWIAELWLLTSKPGDDMSRPLAPLIEKGKLTARADPELAALSQAQVDIEPDRSAAAPWRGTIVRFRGGYVSKFFEPAGREKMIIVANALADATGAEMGALYGRCEHLKSRDIGAWFRGASPAAASAALVRAMAEPKAAPDLAELVARLGKVEKSALESAVKGPGGTFAPGAESAPTVITFPLYGPTLATRASNELAKAAPR
jgi:hypothetical protein